MPVPVSPIRLVCARCNWKKAYAPSSDVLHLPDACPVCGGSRFTQEKAGSFEGALASIDAIWKRLSN
jgi:hypothetical protein